MITVKRVAISVILLCFSTFTMASDTYFCGTLAGKVISVDKAYFFFWPERVGDSWSGESPKMTGCSENIKSIVLEAYLPDMTPAGKKEISSDSNVMHVSIAISKLETSGVNTNFDKLVKYYLRKAPVSQVDAYEKKYGMYKYSGQDPSFSQMHSEIYWMKDEDGSVSVVVKCIYRISSLDSVCTLTRKVPELDAVMDVNFFYTNLPSWNNISEQSLSLLRRTYR